jgi:hypothetical protein
MLKLSDVKNVLILGDSFTDINYPSGEKEQHWINFLRFYYGWKITNLSHSGSGINRIVYELLHLTEDFDLCIMAYSEPMRLFHPDIWDINFGTSLTHKNLRRSDTTDENVWNAAAGYYTHFYNVILSNIKGIGLHQWIDQYIKEKYPDKFFIHFDCFSLKHSNENLLENIKLQRIYHKFSHGMTMYPPLMYLSITDVFRPELSKDRRIGHLGFREHLTVFNNIRHIIDHDLYSNDKVYIYHQDFNESDVVIGMDNFE